MNTSEDLQRLAKEYGVSGDEMLSRMLVAVRCLRATCITDKGGTPSFAPNFTNALKALKGELQLRREPVEWQPTIVPAACDESNSEE